MNELFHKIKQLKQNKFTYFINLTDSNDIHIFDCGYADCKKNQSTDIIQTIPYYSIHCVIKGTGKLEIANKIHTVLPNMIFIIFPNCEHRIYPDVPGVWEISWINIVGLKVENYLSQMNFSINNPVYQFENNKIIQCFSEMTESMQNVNSKKFKAMSILYNLFSLVIDERSCSQKDKENNEDYLLLALTYLNIHYTDSELKLNDVSDHVGLNHSYFSRYFKLKTGIGFSNYLRTIRIQKACELIESKKYYIYQISEMVGYRDTYYFSKEFKKVTQRSPSEYKSLVKESVSRL